MVEQDIIKRMKKKPFRIWFTNQYEEYKLEKEHLGEGDIKTASEYLQTNKTFLIEKYKEYRNGN